MKKTVSTLLLTLNFIEIYNISIDIKSVSSESYLNLYRLVYNSFQLKIINSLLAIDDCFEKSPVIKIEIDVLE